MRAFLNDPVTANTKMSTRPLAQSDTWQMTEYLCSAGPGDKPVEEKHHRVTIALVTGGTFKYRTEAGTALLYPGALLLGNPGTCFECGHDHGIGDRCISLSVATDYFAEIAASVGGSAAFRFSHAMMPAIDHLLRHTACLYRPVHRTDSLMMEAAVVALIEALIQTVSGRSVSTPLLSGRDQRRISAALRYIELNAAEPLTLNELALIAGMSKYHFLRIFRQITGITPYRFLLNARLQTVARELKGSKRSIAAIALDAGFGDLSTFITHFRHTFGVSPSVFRLS